MRESLADDGTVFALPSILTRSGVPDIDPGKRYVQET